MERPFVIRYSQENEEANEGETEEYMVDRIISYFTHSDLEGHKKKWRKKKIREDAKDYYYV